MALKANMALFGGGGDGGASPRSVRTRASPRAPEPTAVALSLSDSSDVVAQLIVLWLRL